MSDNKHESIWMHLYDVPFQQGYVLAGDVKTRYIHAGSEDKPTIVLLHGLGGSWENCFANVREHSKHFNVYAYDMLGHGLTDKPDRRMEVVDLAHHLRDFMDAMGIKHASLVGLSLGSWTATRFTTLWPERVDSVTMISAWGRPQAANESQSVQDSREMLARQRDTRLAAVVNPTWTAMEKIFEGLIADPNKRIPDLLAIRQAFYGQPEMKQSMEQIFAGIDPDAWERNMLTDEQLKAIRTPYLVVAAPDFKDVFLQGSYEYARLIPGAKLVEVNGASHWAQWEQLEQFDRISIEFLEQVHKAGKPH